MTFKNQVIFCVSLELSKPHAPRPLHTVAAAAGIGQGQVLARFVPGGLCHMHLPFRVLLAEPQIPR